MFRDWVSEEEIVAVLRGAPRQPVRPAAFVDMAIRHRVAPLLVNAGATSLLPPHEAERLLADTRTATVKCELRDRELRRVLATLHADRIDAVIMKGAQLAHSHYTSPYLRPCDDVDLVARRGDLERLSALLAREGYSRQHDATADAVLGQVHFMRATVPSTVLDVHWRVAAPRVAADLLPVDELISRAVPVPQLGPSARGLSAVDALALACVHQAAHHPGHDLLLWMYDVHLLIARMSDAEIDEFVARALGRRMARLCTSSVEASARRFPHPAADRIARGLHAAATDELTAMLIGPRRPVMELFSDLRAIRGWRGRIELVLGHLFPPPAYMRNAFTTSSSVALPWLYMYRIVRGVGRWFRVKN